MFLNVILFATFSSVFVVGSVVNPCTTPNDEHSSCISLFECPGLMKALGTLEKSSVQYVHRSICPIGGAGELYVCCGKSDRRSSASVIVATPSPITPKPTKKKPPTTAPAQKDKQAHREIVKSTLLPDRRYCGRQHTDDRYYNDTQTALDEFPWLVHIKITDLEYDSEYGDRCSGVLISSRYVLTDAYCAYHAIKIIVGEHKTDTNISCVADPNFPECTDPAFEVRVEEIVRDGKPENGAFDFALLRLNQTLSFSDYVRPICLPLVQSERPTRSEPLTFSGWGSQGPAVAIKKRLVYEPTTDKDCFDAEFGLDGNIKFANVTLLCIKPKKANTDRGCNGDHGGPLMYSRKAQWFAEAIVIKVYPEDFTCSENSPASSIKIIPRAIDWILDTLRP